jgi:thioredoxin 1
MADNMTYLTLTDQNFQHAVLESTQPVLVDFWADWCGPCHMIAPVIEDLAVTYAGQLTVGKLNVDANPQTVQRYGIRLLPTLLFFKDGQVREQIIGARPRHEITAALHTLFQED